MAGTTRLKDDTEAPPRLRIGLCLANLLSLPADTEGPKTKEDALPFVKAAGFDAVQTEDARAARDAGLDATALNRLAKPEDAKAIAVRNRDEGFDCTILHAGTGLESDDECTALASAIVEASAATGHPLFLETHRATITQDMRRTLDLIARVPQLRFNGDFSHWYTGCGLVLGDAAARIARLSPVFERTRFLHGRVATPGCIQIPAGDPRHSMHLDIFRTLWTKCFAAFLADATAGEYFGFYPELLPASFYYARLIPDGAGGWCEESDRWQDAIELAALARQCWTDAEQTQTTAGA